MQSAPFVRLLLAFACLASIAAAQSNPATPATAPPGATVFHTGTQLVVVDVTVRDKSGNPVHGLKLSNFLLEEGGNRQAIRNFEEHVAPPLSERGLEMPPMPLGVFTNYTPVPPRGTLNIILIDALNTPMTDQVYARDQLMKYIEHADPGSRFAIFGLANHLYMLQGFTSNPAVLKAALDHKLTAQGSSLLTDPTGNKIPGDSLSKDLADLAMTGLSAEIIANVKEFEAESGATTTQFRAQLTLDAFNNLAHYLGSFPGRKNLIWLTGSFPLTIMPDPTLRDAFSSMEDNGRYFRETTNLLTHAQVAVYPIDARGVSTLSAFDTAKLDKPDRDDTITFAQTTADEHRTMDAFAADTGGRAYYNTNRPADAVAQAVSAGADYYTLTYSPSNHKWDNEYRRIHVALDGAADRDLKLNYRHGYFGTDPAKVPNDLETASVSESAEAAVHSPKAYTRAAMSRGAPAPIDIIFKARVVPASGALEDSVAPKNDLNPNLKLKGPFRRYSIDLTALTSNISMTVDPTGNHRGRIELVTYVFDVDGRLINKVGDLIDLNVDAATYATLLKSGLSLHQDVSAPAKGDSYLRVGLHDLRSGHMGVIEVPTSSIPRLPPVSSLPSAASK
jgi:VWFA-related protein